MRRSFKYRLYPTKMQGEALSGLLDAARHLYNAALEQRRTEWTAHRRSLNYYTQAKELKEARDNNPNLSKLNYSTCQAVLRTVQKSFDAFFRRIKAGETPGYPRFKASDRFNSITFPSYGNGVRMRRRLYVQNVGDIKVKLHRVINGSIKTVCLRRQRDKWYAVFSCDNVPSREFAEAFQEVGIDMGLESFATLSTGEKIDNPRWYRKIQNKLAEAQRKYSAHKSKRQKRIIARLHEKAASQRLDFQHKLAHRIVSENSLIAVEDLDPKKMAQRASNGLSKSIHDAAWGQFLKILSDKAEEAGRKFFRVPPGGTSSTCHQCGRHRKKSLSERIHSCECGLVLDRDIHASLNILRLGLSLQASA